MNGIELHAVDDNAVVNREQQGLLSEPSTFDSASPERSTPPLNTADGANNAPIKPRQSSLAHKRAEGTRAPLHVRFDVDDPQVAPSAEDVSRERDLDDESDAWLDDDYLDDSTGNQRRHLAPLLTGIEAPSVTVANTDLDFRIEDLLESSRPKSNMKSAFMNMANSIMWVSFGPLILLETLTDR